MLFSSSALLACFWNENSKKSIEFLEMNNTANVTEQGGNSINNNFKGKNIPNGAR